MGRISITFNQPVVFDPYRVNRDMGSFVLIDRNTRGTKGSGLIEAAEEEAAERPVSAVRGQNRSEWRTVR
ncbi:MAG: hypothetical protein EXR05_10460 [Acetobacteraceae bacterium]|nr:hypothetical protein [Acetobacteraceae bacterium]